MLSKMSKSKELPFITAGSPDKPALLLLHGFLGAKEGWQALMQLFAPTHYCIAIDLPGHGEALFLDQAHYSLKFIAQGILYILDKLHVPRAAILGYSMGGRAALYTAIHNPQRFSSLVLASSSPGLETEGERLTREAEDKILACALDKQTTATFLEEWYQQPLFSSLALKPHLLEQVKQKRMQNHPSFLARAVRGYGLAAQGSLWESLKTFSVPMRVLVGEADLKYRAIAERMVRQNGQIRLTIIPDAGHNIYEENPKAFASFLIDELD